MKAFSFAVALLLCFASLSFAFEQKIEQTASCGTYVSDTDPSITGHKCTACINLDIGEIIDIKSELDMLNIDLNIGDMIPSSVKDSLNINFPGFSLDFPGDFGAVLPSLPDAIPFSWPSHTLNVDLPGVPIGDLLDLFPSVPCNVGEAMVEPVVDKLLQVFAWLGDICVEIWFEECREIVGVAISVRNSRLFAVELNLRKYLSCTDISESIGDLTVTFDYEGREITACYPWLQGFFDANLCFVLDDISWSIGALGFSPKIRFDSTFDSLAGATTPTIDIAKIEIGDVDDCYYEESCDVCAAKDGCEWCNALQACQRNGGTGQCGGCPEDTTPLEFCADPGAMRDAAVDQLDACGSFDEVDLNKDYQLSFDEFERGIGVFYNPDDVVVAFADLDTNPTDNFISYKEYCFPEPVEVPEAEPTPELPPGASQRPSNGPLPSNPPSTTAGSTTDNVIDVVTGESENSNSGSANSIAIVAVLVAFGLLL